MSERRAGKEKATADSVPALPSVNEVVRSPGKALDASTRANMEDRFAHHLGAIRVHTPDVHQGASEAAEGEAERMASQSAPAATTSRHREGGRPAAAPPVDFSHVRVHTGREAAASAQLMGANAYVCGNHVVLDDGQRPAGSAEGQRTLAHELTHVIQQGGIQQGGAQQAGVQQVGARQIGAGPAGGAASLPSPANGSRIAREPKYPVLHQELLKSLISLARKYPKDGPDRVGPLRALAATVPEADRPLLVTRLERPVTQDAFSDYVRNTFPGTRGDFLAALGARSTAAPSTGGSPAAGGAAPSAAGPSAAPAPGPDPAAEPSTPGKGFAALNDARRKPEYIDNGIERLRSDGETAEIFYKDGAKLTLGLTPDSIAAPFDGVDYKSARGEMGTLEPKTPGTIRMVPQVRNLAAPGASVQDALAAAEQRARELKFVEEPSSKRLVPTEVNSLTAPLLCATLRKADEENEALAQATSEGGVKIFKAFGIVLEIAGFLTPAKAARAAAITKGGGVVATSRLATVFYQMRTALASVLSKAVKEGTVVGEVVVEGVSFGTVKATVEAGTFTARYAFIKNVGRVPGRGRLAQWALEEAAKDVAKAQGAKFARVWVDPPIQTKWLAYLESQYYKWVVENTATGFTKGMVKVISL